MYSFTTALAGTLKARLIHEGWTPDEKSSGGASFIRFLHNREEAGARFYVEVSTTEVRVYPSITAGPWASASDVDARRMWGALASHYRCCEPVPVLFEYGRKTLVNSNG